MQVWQSILSQRIDFHAAELEEVSGAARDLLKGLLERDPDARLTPKQALEHPWIKASTLPFDHLAGTHAAVLCAELQLCRAP